MSSGCLYLAVACLGADFGTGISERDCIVRSRVARSQFLPVIEYVAGHMHLGSLLLRSGREGGGCTVRWSGFLSRFAKRFRRNNFSLTNNENLQPFLYGGERGIIDCLAISFCAKGISNHKDMSASSRARDRLGTCDAYMCEKRIYRSIEKASLTVAKSDGTSISKYVFLMPFPRPENEKKTSKNLFQKSFPIKTPKLEYLTHTKISPPRPPPSITAYCAYHLIYIPYHIYYCGEEFLGVSSTVQHAV